MAFLDSKGLSYFFSRLKSTFALKERFSTNADGLVPYPGSVKNDDGYIFLDSNGKWIPITIDENPLKWEDVYPVGSIYMSYESKSPASIFGGGWTQIKNAFIRATNSTTTLSTGGADTRTLTTSNMPAHKHTAKFYQSITESSTNYGLTSGGGFGGRCLVYKSDTAQSGYLNDNGSGSSFNNMPAYQELFVWRRTS